MGKYRTGEEEAISALIILNGILAVLLLGLVIFFW